ncbi:MAG: ATP synthase F1 subunit epsilon [bacterium]|nr:ATP synthase F1 subunit epsilon [Deltaproteobacteria bacterium]MCP4904066.1 ATP synthase F1 subunit epsilon [bacterium]
MALELVVVTPEGEALCEEIEQVVLPGEAGNFGVLESHERFLTPLKPGPMEIIRSGGGNEWAAITSGFAEVDGSRVVVLVDTCALAKEIDRDATESRRAEAADELDGLAADDANAGERARLAGVVARAEVELDVAGR